jgi:phospholipase C
MGSLSQSIKLLVVVSLVLAVAGCGGRGVATKAADSTAAPAVQFSASATSVSSGQPATLSWSTTNATSVTIDGSAVALSGTRVVTPTATTTYVLSATGAGGTTKATVIIAVGAALPLPSIQFSANPASITLGQSSVLSWSTTNATSVSIDSGVSSTALSGSATVSPTGTHTYILTATGSGGTVTANATVTITGNTGQGIKAVNHVIYMLQENRSFDSYFGKLGDYRAANGYGAASDIDGLPAGVSNFTDDKQQQWSSFHFQTMCMEGVSPDWLESHGDYNLATPGSDTFVGDGFVHNGQGLAQFSGTVIETPNVSSSITVQPKVTTNYYLFSSRSGPVLAQLSVNVGTTAANIFFANPDTIASGSTTLNWNIPNATSATIDNGVGTFTGNAGSATVAPAATTTYTLTAIVGTGTVSATATVNISSTPGLIFKASSTSIAPGQSVTLEWNIPGGAEALVSTWFDQPGKRVMGYFDETDLPYYYFMASNFATSDRFFSPISSNSEPNRIYVLSATSHGHVHDPGVFDSSQVKNIFQLLEQAGISWKVYYQTTDSAGVPNTRMDRFQPFRTDHADKIVPASQYFDDLKNGTLPQVAYIEEKAGLDEHPGGTLVGDIHSGNHVQAGAQFMSTFINALMASSFWKDSVFFMTFDEHGGLYDHVSPQVAVHPDGIAPMDLEQKDIDWVAPQGDFNRTGFRVPMMVISPFTKKSYVSHTVADYTAFLKFIETRFNLPSLTARDAAQIDMTEFFNFDAPPWLTPPSPPVQPINKPCDFTNLK